MMKLVWSALALVLLALGLVAGSSFVEGASLVKKDPIAATAPNSVTLRQGEQIGQTFVANHDGLAGIEIYALPQAAGDGEIRLHLRTDPTSSADLAASSLPVASIKAPGFYRFSFAPQPGSQGRSYYALFELAGAGRVKLDRAAGDAYLDGAMYQDGQPLDAQLGGYLVFDSPQMLLGFAGRALGWAGALAIGIFLFILPGWALLVLLWPGASDLSWGEKLGLAGGLSVALYPLLLLWTDLVGLHLGPLYAWVPSMAALIFLAWRNRAARPASLAARARAWWRSGARWPDLAFIAVLALIYITRFLVIGSLDVPMWGDSYQHTMIAQLIADNGGLFDSWQPYAEMQSFNYHFGFHADAALLHWLGGLALPQAILWTGQLLNVIAVVVLYPLAARVGGNRWAGVAAVLLAGLLAPMPMFYVNWGRYTQLAGQVILPIAILLVWQVLDARGPDWRLLGLACFALGGLALTHYRVLIFGMPFLAAYLIFEWRRAGFRALLTKMFFLAAGAGLLYLPWFVHTFGSKLVQIFTKQISTPPQQDPAWLQQANAAGDLSTYLSALVWLLLLLSVGWGLWRRDRGIGIISLWWALVVLAVNPQWLRLPGEGLLTNFALGIAAYIPAGIIIGAVAGQLVGAQHSASDAPADGAAVSYSRQRAISPLLALLVAALGVWGAGQRLYDLQPAIFALITRPDIEAAGWIREHTPKDARFLVNSFFTFGDAAIVGSDGGWWLPLLAGRQTMVPPLNYVSEEGPRPDYAEWIKSLSAELLKKGIDHPDVLKMLRERGIAYVYIGQRQGRVNYGGPYPLEPERVLASPHFHPIYHQNRVWVFEMNR
jgi:hypothetical protein